MGEGGGWELSEVGKGTGVRREKKSVCDGFKAPLCVMKLNSFRLCGTVQGGSER